MRRLLFISGLFMAQLNAQYPSSVKVDDLQAGHLIPEIVGETLDGKEFNLHQDLKGKIVLLDFWATWCGPCIAETPNIQKNYDKWHDEGFEVVGISLDSDSEDARRYITKKKLPWTQLCDSKGFRSPYATSFSIRGIPQFILLDRRSRVIASNVRGERLGQLLEKHIHADPDDVETEGSAEEHPVEVRAMLASLESALVTSSGEKSLKALRPLLEFDESIDSRLQDLAYAHRPLDSTSPHLKTVYLMAERVMSRGTITQEMQRYAGTARAHAALELGGPYLAESHLNSLARFRQKLVPEYEEVEIHLARVTHDGDRIISRLLRAVVAGSARYDEVDQQLKICKEFKVTRADELSQLEFWLKSQNDLPEDRVTLEVKADAVSATYRPRGTNLAGAMELELVMVLESGQSIELPMTLDAADGSFKLEAALPDSDGPVRVFFRDAFKRSDSNEGQYWVIPD